jgi:flagellar basal-body rod protein FlgB
MRLETPMAEVLNRYLDLSSLELKLTAQNMANVDTPGYRTVGFNFAGAMSRSLEEMGRNGDAADLPAPEVVQVGGLLERPDGNNVSMDREGLDMAKAQLQFQAGVALLRQEFTREMDAIHEDK